MSDAYSLLVTAAAKKRLGRHRHAQAQILKALQTLESNPLAGRELAGQFRGFHSLKIFVKGSGEYRALYSIDNAAALVIVHWISTRENFYVEAERHLFG